MTIGPTQDPDSIAQWHPRLVALYRYWQSLRPGDALPPRSAVDPSAIKDQLATLWMIDVVYPPPLRFRYRLTGTRLREAFGREMTGLWFDEMHPEVAGQPGGFTRFIRVATQSIVDWRRGRPALLMPRADFVEVENLLMPMATDGRTVDIILAGSVFYRQDGSEA